MWLWLLCDIHVINVFRFWTGDGASRYLTIASPSYLPSVRMVEHRLFEHEPNKPIGFFLHSSIQSQFRQRNLSSKIRVRGITWSLEVVLTSFSRHMGGKYLLVLRALIPSLWTKQRLSQSGTCSYAIHWARMRTFDWSSWSRWNSFISASTPGNSIINSQNLSEWVADLLTAGAFLVSLWCDQWLRLRTVGSVTSLQKRKLGCYVGISREDSQIPRPEEDYLLDRTSSS